MLPLVTYNIQYTSYSTLSHTISFFSLHFQTKLGHVAPSQEPAATPHDKWGRSTPAATETVKEAGNSATEEEDFSELEYSGLPLWKKALMKKRAEEESAKNVEQERKVYTWITAVAFSVVLCCFGIIIVYIVHTPLCSG